MQITISEAEAVEAIRQLQLSATTIQRYIAYYQHWVDIYAKQGKQAPLEYSRAVTRERVALAHVKSVLAKLREGAE